MNERLLTLEIYPQDCVGDSSAKHNFNALSLDTTLCNLSSKFFIVEDNYTKTFLDFQNNLQDFINLSNNFFDPKPYNLAKSTVQNLSSYWNKHEFSIHYPLNINSVANLNCPTINQPDNVLQSMALVFLSKNYPARQYTKDTIANVVFFLYSVPVDPTNPDSLQSTITSPELSYSVRNMNVSINRQDIHFKNGKTFKYQNNGNGSWIYIKTESGTPLPVLNNFVSKPAPPSVRKIIVPIISSSTRTPISLKIDTNVFNYDVYAETLNSGGYIAGYTDVYLTITNTSYVGSTMPSVPAMLVSASSDNSVGFVKGDTVSIINNGKIIGAGGNGGAGQSWGRAIDESLNGKNGGDAIQLNFPTNIENNGTIAGGGGGGAGGYIGVTNQNIFDPTKSIQNLYAGGGGGGGAGIVAGSFGKGGIGYNNVGQVSSSTRGALLNTNLNLINSGTLNGNDGFSGNVLNGGNGGTGGNGAANGGTGGSLGSDGINTGPIQIISGVTTAYPPIGGKAGNYINGKNFLNLVAEGLLYGKLI